MELSKVEEHINMLPEEQRNSILKLIDIKTEQDMREVINSIKHLENKFDNKIGAIESQIKLLFWAIGVVITLIIALKIFG